MFFILSPRVPLFVLGHNGSPVAWSVEGAVLVNSIVCGEMLVVELLPAVGIREAAGRCAKGGEVQLRAVGAGIGGSLLSLVLLTEAPRSSPRCTAR